MQNVLGSKRYNAINTTVKTKLVRSNSYFDNTFNHALWFCILKLLKSLQNVPKSPQITPEVGTPKLYVKFWWPLFLALKTQFFWPIFALLFYYNALIWIRTEIIIRPFSKIPNYSYDPQVLTRLHKKIHCFLRCQPSRVKSLLTWGLINVFRYTPWKTR